VFFFVACLVPSQVVVARTLTKKNAMMSVTTKVVMQLNCKLGGELWALEIPVCVFVLYVLKDRIISCYVALPYALLDDGQKFCH